MDCCFFVIASTGVMKYSPETGREPGISMKTKPFLPSIACALILAGGLFAQVADEDPQTIDIQLRYQPGKTYTVVTEMATNTEMDFGGEKMENNQVMTFVLDNKVTAIEGSENLHLLMTYTRVVMVMNAMGEVMVFDSADETKNQGQEGFSDMVANLVGKKITLEMTPEMNVENIEGIDELYEDAEFGEMDAEAVQTLKEDHVELLTGAEFSNVLPEKPVKEGDEWPYFTTAAMPMMGSLEVRGTSTLREVSLVDGRLQAVVEVEAKGKSLAAEKDEEEDKAEDELEVEILREGQVKKMNMKGEYVIDILDGYVVEATVESDILYLMDIGGGEAPMEMPMKNITKSVTTMK